MEEEEKSEVVEESEEENNQPERESGTTERECWENGQYLTCHCPLPL